MKGRSLAAVTRVLSNRELKITAGENRLAALNPQVGSQPRLQHNDEQADGPGRADHRGRPDGTISSVTKLANDNLIESRVTDKLKRELKADTRTPDASDKDESRPHD